MNNPNGVAITGHDFCQTLRIFELPGLTYDLALLKYFLENTVFFYCPNLELTDLNLESYFTRLYIMNRMCKRNMALRFKSFSEIFPNRHIKFRSILKVVKLLPCLEVASLNLTKIENFQAQRLINKMSKNLLELKMKTSQDPAFLLHCA